MSFDSLSKNAIVKLNQGAQKEKLHHNTGKGGLIQYHQHMATYSGKWVLVVLAAEII